MPILPESIHTIARFRVRYLLKQKWQFCGFSLITEVLSPVKLHRAPSAGAELLAPVPVRIP